MVSHTRVHSPSGANRFAVYGDPIRRLSLDRGMTPLILHHCFPLHPCLQAQECEAVRNVPGISGITKHALLLAHIRLLERVARWSAFLQSSRSVHSRRMLSRIQMNNFLPFSLLCLSLSNPRSPPCVLAAGRRSPVVYVWWQRITCLTRPRVYFSASTPQKDNTGFR
jgi:hypothetical protein